MPLITTVALLDGDDNGPKSSLRLVSVSARIRVTDVERQPLPLDIVEREVAVRSLRVKGLPVSPSGLVGRAREVAELSELLGRSRIVTIVGAGGVGKTQLALEVARRLAFSFADGAAFVSLADLEDPALVPSEIARSLDLVDASGAGLTEQLIAALQSLRILIVLDNLEHLVAATPAVAWISSHCPGTTFLVTSRRRLGLTTERTFRLSPLPVPAPDAQGELIEVASIALFCERAASVSSHFEADGADLEAIGEICRLLDGMPLAIELVASHVRVLAPEALLARLQDAASGWGLLKGGAADADARHRDLRQTIGWSVDLLSGPAARLLPRLSVFREGWTLEAMEHICCADLRPDTAFDAIVELVDLHLVEPVDTNGAAARFRLLETVRRFATDVLADVGDVADLMDRHADYFGAFAMRAGAGLQGKDEHRWVARVDRELPNVRAALQHLAASGRGDDGLAAAAAFGPYWLDRGPMHEGRDWIDRFLSSATGPLRVRAIAEGWSARLALEQGEVGASPDAGDRDKRLRWARDVLDREGDVIEWLRLTDHLGNSLHLQGRFADADALLVEALERCRTSDTAWLRAELLLTRAVNSQDSGSVDREQIFTLFEEATSAARLARHDRARAQAVGRMNLTIPPHQPVVTDAMAKIEQAFRLSLDHGDRRNAARSAVVAAVLALADRDRAAAATWFVRALDISVTIGYWHGVAWSVMGVTGLAARAGRLVEGARLHGAMRPRLDRISRETPQVQIAAYQRLVELLRDGLGHDFEAECRAGEERAWTVTVEEARRVAAELSGDAKPTTRRSHRRRGPQANPELTDRELDVLGELVAGCTNRRVADDLGISPKTVMHHTVSVYRKLGVRGRAEAVAHALRAGLVAS